MQDQVHPQTIAVCQSRASGLGLTVEVAKADDFNIDKDVSGILVQYPATDGSVHDYKVGAVRSMYMGLPQAGAPKCVQLGLLKTRAFCTLRKGAAAAVTWRDTACASALYSCWKRCLAFTRAVSQALSCKHKQPWGTLLVRACAHSPQ